MQIIEIAEEGLKRGFKIIVPAADIENKVAGRIDNLVKTVNLPGFRRGKVPAKVVRKKFGKSLLGEILEKTVEESSLQVLTTNNLRPALKPKIEITSFDEGTDLEYTIDVEVLPEITLMDFKTIQLEKPVVAVTDEMLNKQLARLTENQKLYRTVDRVAVNGDAVIIDYLGTVDGVEFDGGKGEDYQLILGSETFIPGFEEQLLGAMAGDQKDINITFPADYGAQKLAGKRAVFRCDVKEVKEGSLPELDDAFASSLGLENLDRLRDAVRDQMRREHDNQSRNAIKRRLLDKLADEYDFAVPTSLVDIEFDAIWGQLNEEMKRNGETFEALEQGENEARAEYKGIAERRVRLGLLLSEVGRLQNIQISDNEVSRATMEHARRFPGKEREVFEMFQNNPQAREQLRAPILEEKVVDYILELAVLIEKPMSMDELLSLDQNDPAQEKKTAGKKSTRKQAASKGRASPSKAKTRKSTTVKSEPEIPRKTTDEVKSKKPRRRTASKTAKERADETADGDPKRDNTSERASSGRLTDARKD